MERRPKNRAWTIANVDSDNCVGWIEYNESFAADMLWRLENDLISTYLWEEKLFLRLL